MKASILLTIGLVYAAIVGFVFVLPLIILHFINEPLYHWLVFYITYPIEAINKKIEKPRG